MADEVYTVDWDNSVITEHNSASKWILRRFPLFSCIVPVFRKAAMQRDIL